MRNVLERIDEYLQLGGLFNPELANHHAVRNLIIDCRDYIKEQHEINERCNQTIRELRLVNVMEKQMPYVEVDINSSEFCDIDFIDELQDRGYTVIRGELGDADEIKDLYKDYKAYGFTEKFQKILEEFFEDVR